MIEPKDGNLESQIAESDAAIYHIDSIITEICNEINQQHEKGYADNDDSNTENDWVAIISAYLGRAAAYCYRNYDSDFRKMILKSAALCISAIVSYDDNSCLGCAYYGLRNERIDGMAPELGCTHSARPDNDNRLPMLGCGCMSRTKEVE